MAHGTIRRATTRCRPGAGAHGKVAGISEGELAVTNDIIDLATRVGQALRAKRLLLSSAESCTGGGVAQAVTEIAGSSDWFERGFVTYSNDAKHEMLGVSGDIPAPNSYVR